jgi:hypothetical protein
MSSFTIVPVAPATRPLYDLTTAPRARRPIAMKKLLVLIFVLVVGATPTPPQELPQAGRCLSDATAALMPPLRCQHSQRAVQAVAPDGAPLAVDRPLAVPVADRDREREVCARPATRPASRSRMSQGPPASV